MNYSVIIPTMWKSHRTEKMLSVLEKSNYVKQIIIIDNDTQKRNIILENFSKVHYFPMEENIFVNKAWNMGKDFSDHENILLLNDDVSFDIEYAFHTVKDVLQNAGIIGINMLCYNPERYKNTPALLKVNHMTGGGFGCALFMKTERYKMIPSEIKVWFGDNWLFETQTLPNYALGGLFVETEMSTSVSTIPRQIIQQDIENWKLIKLRK